MEKQKIDVLIIGGGAAGSYAALKAFERGVSVALVEKGIIGESGTSSTCGGSGPAAVLPPYRGEAAFSSAVRSQFDNGNDSEEIFADDTSRGGERLNSTAMTKILVSEGKERLFELDRWGLPSDKKPDGTFRMVKTLGFSFPRARLVAQRGTIAGGQVLMEFFRQRLVQLGVRIFEGVMISDLLLNNGVVVGALGIMSKGDFIVFEAKVTILAGGSATKLFPYTSATYRTTGDGYAMALRAGARLFNMEFQEFTLVPVIDGVPFSTQGTKPLIAAGCRWINSLGERYMERYDPQRLEFTTRGTMVRANYMERKAGRGPVFLDFSHVPSENRAAVEARFFYRKLKERGKDPWKELFEWVPAVHSFLGGIRISRRTEAGIPGLYSAGEAAGHGGAFGADRIGSGLGASYIFGARAGVAAAEHALGTRSAGVDMDDLGEKQARVEKLKPRDRGVVPQVLEQEIRQLAWDSLGVVRNESSLRKAVERFRELRETASTSLSCTGPQEVIAALELENLALIGEAASLAALERRESRGQHYREDHPESNDREWLKWITFSLDRGTLKLDCVPVP